MFRCGLWASSRPFPLSAHYGLYKRGRDPPTNPSRHLKKERSELPLKWLFKEDRRRRPTAASAAAAAAARRCAAAAPAAETAASSCSLHVLPKRFTDPSHRRRHRRITVPPPFPSTNHTTPSIANVSPTSVTQTILCPAPLSP